MRRVLVLGAHSAIAQACARRYAEEGHALVLVGRDPHRLQAQAEDLRVRGASEVATVEADFADVDAHDSIWLRSDSLLSGSLDTVLLAFGVLPNQSVVEANPQAMREAFWINANAALSMLTVIANGLEGRPGSQIGVISSVAGDRGRRSNYCYGAAKAALSAFTLGLGQRLHSKGVSVTLIKPGFVDTPMTAGFRKGVLWAKPDRVARDIVAAMRQRRPVAYTPPFWRWIMAVVTHLPEFILRRRPI